MKRIISLMFIFVSILMFSPVALTSALTPPDENVVTATSTICSSNSMRSISGIINWASCMLIKTIVPFLFSLATVAFIWGVIQFYLNPENEEKRKKGKSFIIGGLIALFVMLSMWGLVSIFTTTFQIKNTIPQLPD